MTAPYHPGQSADFKYPRNVTGYKAGVSLGTQRPYGAVLFVETPFRDGEGYIKRGDEIIGYIHPTNDVPSWCRYARGWVLTDLVGNRIGFDVRRMDLIGRAAWELPGADAQHAFLEALKANRLPETEGRLVLTGTAVAQRVAA